MMNGKCGAGRGTRRAGVLAVVVAVAASTAACGVHISLRAGPASTAGYQANLAYAHCMRNHGVPHFPIPSPGASFHISGHPHGQQASTPRARANAACEHLLPPGSVT